MKYLSLLLIVSSLFVLSGCTTTKVIIEHREIPSSLSAGSILRAPVKISYLDEGKLPPEVLALAIKYQKIAETGRWRDLVALELPDKPSGSEEVSRRTDYFMGAETDWGPKLLILREIRHSASPGSFETRTENWIFLFAAVGRGIDHRNATFYRDGNGKFRLIPE